MVAPAVERYDPAEILNIQRGASVFIYAAALSLLFSPQPPTLETINTTFNKIIPPMSRMYRAQQGLHPPIPSTMPSMPRQVNIDETVNGMDLSRMQLLGFYTELLAQLEEKTHLKEKLVGAQLIALVGEQGCGKGVVGSVFEECGFSALPMSDLVKDAASVEGRNRNDTQVKIDIGRELKGIFGDGILALIAVAYALEDGNNKILLDGPRITGEIDQIRDLGGTAIGVILNEDENIDREERRRLIGLRAQKDPKRIKDVAAFDSREAQEHDLLRPILMNLSSERRIVNNFGSAEDFKEATQKWLFGPNGLLEQEKS